jgi:hypothetical protein
MGVRITGPTADEFPKSNGSFFKLPRLSQGYSQAVMSDSVVGTEPNRSAEVALGFVEAGLGLANHPKDTPSLGLVGISLERLPAQLLYLLAVPGLLVPQC